MTTPAKVVLGVVALEAWAGSAVVAMVYVSRGLDGFLPMAHAAGLGLFPWSKRAQVALLAVLVVSAVAHCLAVAWVAARCPSEPKSRLR